MEAEGAGLLRRAVEISLQTIGGVWSPQSRLFPGYLASAAACALALAVCTGRVPRLRDWLFPRGWLAGFWLDAQLFAVNAAVFGLFLTGLVMTQGAVDATVGGWLRRAFDPPSLEAHLLPRIAYTLGMLAVYDFSRYLGHWLQHAVPALWQLHKVHHSATTLTPLTLLRTHPLADLHMGSLSALLTGAFSGGFRFVYPGLTEVTVVGVNCILFASYLLASLRHSQVPFGFGPVMSRIFISPRQHQVHHSCLRQHIDKNYGVTLAIWDSIFGTLYVPRSDEELELGLGPGEKNRHASLWDAYVQPLSELLGVRDDDDDELQTGSPRETR